MSKQVFKLQRPIYSTDPDPMVLAYNRKRTEEYHIRLTDEDIEEIFGYDYKVYAKCKLVDGQFEVYDRVKDRNW